MKPTSMKTLAVASAAVIGLATAGTAHAQTENVTATLITSSAITTAKVSDMDFGEYLIQFVTGDSPTLTLTDDNSVAVTQTGSVANGSQVVQITGPASEGLVNVQIPAPGTLQLVASNLVDFADGGLTLDTVTFRTATENGSLITGSAVLPAVSVTVLSGATDEAVRLGGNIDIGATPADNTHTASYDITFSY